MSGIRVERENLSALLFFFFSSEVEEKKKKTSRLILFCMLMACLTYSRGICILNARKCSRRGYVCDILSLLQDLILQGSIFMSSWACFL